MSDEIPYSRKDERKLSPFIGHELLYDYLSRNLDPERMKAMDEVVRQNREIQDEIQSLSSALNYVENLADSDVAENILLQVRQPTSYFQGLLQKIRFHDWPHGLKLGLEVLTVTSMLAAGAIFLPWHKLVRLNWGQPGGVVISELKNEFKTRSQTEEEVAPKQIQTEVPGPAAFQDEASPSVPEPPVKVAATKPADQLAPKSDTKAPIKSAGTVVSSTSSKQKGSLYRGVISVVNLDATSDKFVEKITELGGRKAGEVELGWKKPEGAYFHFTIPETKYEELTEYLREYGALKIQKEPHERVMPDGIIRLIISVSESKKKTSP
jgi:hypothetical protein